MTRQQTEFYRLFAEHGTGDARVSISPQEVVMLILVASMDLAVKVSCDNKLKQQYVDCGGRYYIGHDAWAMLKEKAGYGMGIFVDKYIYPPINTMETHLNSNPRAICLQKTDDTVIVSNMNEEYRIKRI